MTFNISKKFPLLSASAVSLWPLWDIFWVAVKSKTSATVMYVWFSCICFLWSLFKRVIKDESVFFLLSNSFQAIIAFMCASDFACTANPLSLKVAFFQFLYPTSDINTESVFARPEFLQAKQYTESWHWEYSIHGCKLYHGAWKFLRLSPWRVLGKTLRCGWTGTSALDVEMSKTKGNGDRTKISFLNSITHQGVKNQDEEKWFNVTVLFFPSFCSIWLRFFNQTEKVRLSHL